MSAKLTPAGARTFNADVREVRQWAVGKPDHVQHRVDIWRCTMRKLKADLGNRVLQFRAAENFMMIAAAHGAYREFD